MRDRFESFGGIVLEVNRCIQKMKDIEMKEFGLKGGHMMMLYHLGQHENGLTATQLTKLCRSDKAAISRSMKELIAKGVISCDSPEDKRSYRSLIALTPEGRRIVDKLNSDISSLLFDGSEGVTDEEREILYTTLYQIKKNLDRHLDNML